MTTPPPQPPLSQPKGPQDGSLGVADPADSSGGSRGGGGVRVLVPRGGRPGRELAGALADAGFTPVVVPLITFGPPVDGAPLLEGVGRLAAGAYDWLVLTSERTVDALAEASGVSGTSERTIDALAGTSGVIGGSAADRPSGRQGPGAPTIVVPATTRIAAVGPSTARRARRAGLDVDVVPDWDRTATGLLTALVGPRPDEPHLPRRTDGFPPSDGGNPSIRGEERNAPLDSGSVHESRPDPLSNDALSAGQHVDSRSVHGSRTDRVSDHSAPGGGAPDSGSVQNTGPDQLSSVAVRAFAPRSAIARPELVDGLRAAGWHVDAPDAYVTELATSLPDEALDVDVVVLTSSSTAETWATLAGTASADETLTLDGVATGTLPRPWRIVSIGPRTTATARTFGLRVEAEATTPDVPALVAAVSRITPPSDS